MSTSASATIDLNLGTEPNHPRRIVPLPNNPLVLAYGGDDGTVTSLSLTALSDPPKTIKTYDDGVRTLSLSHDGRRVAIGLDDSLVQIYSYDDYDCTSSETDHPFSDCSENDMSMSQPLTQDENEDGSASATWNLPRFSTPVRDVCFDPSGKSYYLAISTEDTGGFYIIDCRSSESSERRYLQAEAEKAHVSSGMRGSRFSPSGDHLASLGMDGRLCIWDVSGDDPEVDWELISNDVMMISKRDMGELMGADVYDRSSFMKWSRDGTWLGLVGSTDVRLRRVGEWNKDYWIMSESGKGHSDVICSMDFDKSGKFVVTTGRDKKVILWELGDGDTPGRYVCDVSHGISASPTDVLWRDDVVYISTAEGKLHSFPIELSSLTRQETLVIETDLNTQPEPDIEVVEVKTPKRLLKKSTHADSDEEEELFDDSTPVRPDSNKRFVVDEADENSDAETEIESSNNQGIDLSYSFPTDDPTNDNIVIQESTNPTKTSIIAKPPLQKSFAPASTPLHQSRQILCWNHHGVITAQESSHENANTIEISFRESATRSTIIFRDDSLFSLGTLGEDGALFATSVAHQELEEDDEFGGVNLSEQTKSIVRNSIKKKSRDGSAVYFHRYETVGLKSEKDWHVKLKDGEEVTGCATGEGWAAVVTDKRFLRMFTSGGGQMMVSYLPGDPIAICGRGKLLAVVYQAEGTLKYMLLDAVHQTKLASGNLMALSVENSLTWIGFSNQNALCAMDSCGMLSMLVPVFGWEWVPMLDTTSCQKSREDSFWPVTLMDGKLVCIPLKGGKKFPDPYRRPITMGLSLKMPLAHSVIGQSSHLEELSIRANCTLQQNKFINTLSVSSDPSSAKSVEMKYTQMCAMVDKLTLKLIFSSLELNKDELSLDLVERLHLEKSVNIAIQASDRCNKRNLSDIIEEIRDRKFSHDDLEEEDYLTDEEQVRDTSYNNQLTQRTSNSVSPETRKRVAPSSPIEVDSEQPTPKRRVTNPFLKKKVESPGKNIMVSPPRNAILSRMSTFSKNSREESKLGKHIL